MIDTIRLKIPVNRGQHDRMVQATSEGTRFQWVRLDRLTGDIDFVKVRGLTETDQHSYHRQIMWEVPDSYAEGATFLTCELSLPKLWYGHNINLLYGFTKAIALLKERIEEQFKLKRNRLPDIKEWQIFRLDVCYAWKFPNQSLAQQYLDSLKHIQFPRKNYNIRDTSIMFAGKTYSLKFYLKYPEFKAHDFKELIKAKANLEYVNYLEELAKGILRYEVTLRRQYLKIRGINTIGDLVQPKITMELDDSWPTVPSHLQLAINTTLNYQFLNGFDEDNFEDGHMLTEPEGVFMVWDHNGETMIFEDENENLCKQIANGETSSDLDKLPADFFIYKPCGRTITLRKSEPPIDILQFMLFKFIGENTGMQKVDEVETKLMVIYKPVKASRLTAFWLYVRQFGTARAKEQFGRDSYYRSKSELKKAGVSLVDLPKNVIPLDRDFLQQFKLEVPSQFVVNKVDDFRDSQNVLNLPQNKDHNDNSQVEDAK